MSQYYNIKTNAGDAAIAKALANNTKLNITHVVFGDGGGSVPNPSKNRTSLINEVHRQAVSKYTQHPTVSKWLTIETIIPSNTGGFWIREIGIIADGVLISHGSHAPFFKVADMEGVSEYRLKFTIDIQDASIVQLTLDESLIYATQAWVNENYVPRADIIDNLTTADATKPLSAAQGKALQDSKLGKTENAVSATKLQTARTIGGVSFDGTANINLPGVNTAGNQSTSGNAATATKLQTARTINGVAFDGTANITVEDNTKLPLAGGTMTGPINFNLSHTEGAFHKLIEGTTVTDGGYIAVGNHGSDRGYLELGTVDDPDAAIYARKRNEANGVIAEAVILGPDGNTFFPHSVLIHGGYGICGLVNGNGDAASYSSHNMVIRSWWGIGFRDNQDVCRTVLDTRTGNFSTQGTVAAASVQVGGAIQSTAAVSFLNGGSAQTINTGGVLASYSYSDAYNVPPQGIYSKGKIHTATSVEVGSSVDGAKDTDYIRAIIHPPTHTGGDWEHTVRDDATYAYYKLKYGTAGYLQLRSDGVLSASGGFDGNASTATKLQTARTISIGGAVQGSAVFDGSSNISINTSSNHGVIRAYANFNGVSNYFRKNVGIASIENQGHGRYLVTLSNIAPDANYIVQATCSHARGDAGSVNLDPTFTQTVNQFRLKCNYGGDNTVGSFTPEFLNILITY